MKKIRRKVIQNKIKDRLRPYYVAIKEAVGNSSVWPAPRNWREKKKLLNKLKTIDEIYDFAATEFEIHQVKSEIISFVEHVSGTAPKVIGEIGVKWGGNSFLFTQAFPRANLFCLLDLKLNNVRKIRYFSRPRQKLVFVGGDSSCTETVSRVKKALAGRQFDLLFIDGDHSYEGVKKDFLLYRSLVRRGGFIAFHDIVPDESARSEEKIKGSQIYSGGVFKLWEEIANEYEHYEFVESSMQNGFGIGIIIN